MSGNQFGGFRDEIKIFKSEFKCGIFVDITGGPSAVHKVTISIDGYHVPSV
jgi:hypothetical protein